MINWHNIIDRRWASRPPLTPSMLKLLLVFLYLTALAAQTPPASGQQTEQPTKDKTALVTIVTNDEDLMPALTMLYTARKNGKLSSTTHRILMTSEQTRLQNLEAVLQADNITLMTYARDDMPLLSLFKLEQFTTVVYITPRALVTNHLSEIFTCSTICAVFVNPCSFSTDVFAITPSQNTFEQLTAFANASNNGCETDAQRPDWLDKPACILNAHFGKALMQAPMHARSTSIIQRSQRMNIAWAFPHHLFYPRMRIELAERFQPLRIITFDQSSGLQPWKWQSYAFAQISWQWYQQRKDWSMKLWQLRLGSGLSSEDVASDSVGFWVDFLALPLVYFVVMGLVLWALLGILTAAWMGRVGQRLVRRTVLSNGNVGPPRDEKTSPPTTGVMLLVLAVGTLVVNWGVCFATIPQSTDPYAAGLYIIVAHVCLTTLMRLYFSLPTYIMAFSRLRVGIVKTFALSFCEIVGLFLAVWMAHLAQATTLFQHVFYIVVAFAGYFMFCLVNTAYTSLLWQNEG